jgi:hypothetical protein
MSKFKKGDIIICVNKIYQVCRLRIGKIYQVEKKIDELGITIVGLTGYWSNSQFELAESQIKLVKQFGIVKFCKEHYK